MREQVLRKPFPYIGGKGRWFYEIVSCIPKDIKTYVEVFGGSYAIGLRLMSEFYLAPDVKFVYNDVSVDTLSIFHALSKKECVDIIYNKLNNTTVTKELYNQSKEIIDSVTGPINFNELSIEDLADLAYHAVIMFNFSFNGNGKNFQQKDYDLEKELAFVLDDWNKIISKYNFEKHSFNGMRLSKEFDQKDVFMLVDPPYMYDKVNRKVEKLYKNEMNTPEEHEKFIKSYMYAKANIIINGYDNTIYDKCLITNPKWHKYILEENAEKRSALRKNGELPTATEYIWSNMILPLTEVKMNPKRKAVKNDVNNKRRNHAKRLANI